MNLDKRIANDAKDATWGMAKKRESVSIERERELEVWCSARGPRCERCTSYRWEAFATLWWQKEDAANTFRSRPLPPSREKCLNIFPILYYFRDHKRNICEYLTSNMRSTACTFLNSCNSIRNFCNQTDRGWCISPHEKQTTRLLT